MESCRFCSIPSSSALTTTVPTSIPYRSIAFSEKTPFLQGQAIPKGLANVRPSSGSSMSELKLQNIEESKKSSELQKKKMKLDSLSHSLHSISSSLNPHSLSPNAPQPNPNNRFIKFRTSHRENLRYLKSLGLIRPETAPKNLPLPDAAASAVAAVELLKSRGFTDADIPRLAGAGIPNIDAALAFLSGEVGSSAEEARRMIVRCPGLVFADVDYCLRPTLTWLLGIGIEIERLRVLTALNAHLLNMRVSRLEKRVGFVRSLGMSGLEAERLCGRFPAVFGYGVESNLRPKFEYLVWEMERSLEELKDFPQYLAFSLEKRIAPRHLHLKARDLNIPLNTMLTWSDHRFYSRWK